MKINRFIDLAAHGGCSKKGPAKEIRNLLKRVQESYSGSHLELISKNFPDTGIYTNGQTLLSTIDVVLPMVLSPADFGKITVSHVLNDLYAGGALPLFALCILGVPSNMKADSDDAVKVLAAAVEQLSAENALLVGGHTMVEQEDFYLGFSAVGTLIGSAPFEQAQAQPGDRLILTKPLGTSIATLRWKMGEASEADHGDVIAGMLRSNREAALFLSKHSIHACTDVTGYGLLGHLYNILFASGVAAKIRTSEIPCYDSLRSVLRPDYSRQAIHNSEYVAADLKRSVELTPQMEALLFDSQVSGGLLASVRAEDAPDILAGLQAAGYIPSIIGEVCDGAAGAIELTN
jgi:selenide, water dikinase